MDPYGAALLDAQALQRAAGWGVAVKVESARGSVTLTPAFMANLSLAQGERLAVALTEGDDRLPLPGALAGRRAATGWSGEPLAVSLARIDAAGVARPLTTWPAPLVVSHPVHAADEIEAATMAVFAQVSDRAQLEPLGGRLSAEGDRIEVAQAAPGSTVLLAYDNRFSDVPPSHWAYRIVHEMAARQVLRGVTPTAVCPGAAHHPGQLAAILARALKLGEDDRFARIYYDISPYDAAGPRDRRRHPGRHDDGLSRRHVPARRPGHPAGAGRGAEPHGRPAEPAPAPSTGRWPSGCPGWPTGTRRPLGAGRRALRRGRGADDGAFRHDLRPAGARPPGPRPRR